VLLEMRVVIRADGILAGTRRPRLLPGGRLPHQSTAIARCKADEDRPDSGQHGVTCAD
jgi:hypothetical protein